MTPDATQPVPAIPAFLRSWKPFAAVAIVAIVGLVFAPTTWLGFIWDDDKLVTANPAMVGPSGFGAIWTTIRLDDCPLTQSAFWAIYRIWGEGPMVYHLATVLIHGLAATALWVVLRQFRVPGAWFGAVLWAIHPVQVESVAWVSEMKNGLSGLFFLLCVYCFGKWIANDPGHIGTRVWYAVSIVCGALAVTAKASAVVLPVILVLCVWKHNGRPGIRLWRGIAPIALCAAAMSLATSWSVRAQAGNLLDKDPRWARSIAERVIAAGQAIWFYVGKLVWPHPLMMVYPRWTISSWETTEYIAPVAVVAALAIAFLLRRRIGDWPFFIGVWFVICLMPALGLVDHPVTRYSFVFDHYQYLASMGMIPLGAAAIFQMTGFVRRLPVTSRRWLAGVICGIVGVAMAGLDMNRIPVFANESTLWADEISKNPESWVGWYAIGHIALNNDRTDNAIEYLRRAILLNPTSVESHNDMGVALASERRLPEAESQLREAITLAPNWPTPRANLGIVFTREGRWAEAVTELRAALKISPDFEKARTHLAEALKHLDGGEKP